MKHVAETNTGELHKRSLRIAGHRTSLALEQKFWIVLDELAKWKGVTIPVLIAQIDEERGKNTPEASLASAARVACLEFMASHLTQTLRNNVLDKLAA